MTAERAERALEGAAEDLAQDHAAGSGRALVLPLLAGIRRGERLERWLREARQELASPAAHAVKASEWVLDNVWLVRRTARQVRRDLPPGFYAHLPPVAGDPTSVPRVYRVAERLLQAADVQLTTDAIVRFLQSYQHTTVLTIAELWALPTMLRLACLELLVGSVARLVPTLPPPVSLAHCQGAPGLEDTEGVARAVRNLQALSRIPWEEILTRTSAVEAVLGEDPAGAYVRMDAPTRGRYRSAVERLARATGRPEDDTARRVVRQAAGAPAGSAAHHVGHWLVSGGLPAFEAALGFRPPWRTRLARRLARHGVSLYLLALAVVSGGVLLVALIPLVRLEAGLGTCTLAALVGLLPATTLGTTLVQWVLALCTHPRVLCKMDFSAGIPPAARTVVTIPCLVGTSGEVDRALAQIELHHLCNPDPALVFVLLTDFGDAPQPEQEGDAALLQRAVQGVRALNRRHDPSALARFHLLHRDRTWNPSEGTWMGWERKRGKLVLLNRLLLDGDDSGFPVHEGGAVAWKGVRYVITLDADTRLPRQAAARLVAILEHPLNRPRVDRAKRRVVSGYAVVQPRVAVLPAAGLRSVYARLTAGDSAIDIYSHAASDLYQDLFGEGSYVGKGIYDVAAFEACLRDRIPANVILSHDLIEGLHARAALATDVVLYEECPAHYLVAAWRAHRWIRGDWQLLPWLGRRVPTADGRVRNPLGLLDRWKILDNLRRSLLAPGVLAWLIVGWLWLPGPPALWTLLGVLAPAGHLFTGLLTGLARHPGRRFLAVAFATGVQSVRDGAGRWLLLLAFLPHEAVLACDAVLRACARQFVTHRNRLQWTPFDQAQRRLAGRTSLRQLALEMAVAPLVGTSLALALAFTRPAALPWAAPLLGVWILAPAIARRLGRPPREPTEAPASSHVDFLRAVARRTWLFFEVLVGPGDHWLPPDNLQEDRRDPVAHRTSPTNIGMLLLSTVVAWDLGYIGVPELEERLRNSLDTLSRLPRYRGHLLNWYDSRTLEPLLPAYVSTADSGNLAACLWAVAQACREAARAPILPPERWRGLADTLRLLEEAATGLDLPAPRDGAPSPGALARALRQQALDVGGESERAVACLEAIAEHELPALDAALMGALKGRRHAAEVAALRELRTWLERTHQHVAAMRRDARRFLPPPEPSGAPSGPAEPAGATRPPGARKEIERLGEALLDLAQQAGVEVAGMEFGFLFDAETRVFHIGYDASSNRHDPHHYDLLASEARLASFVAIAKGDVPVSHWFALGRPMARAAGQLALLSWGGTMFEYLMPPLLTRSLDGTLLDQAQRAAIELQIRHGRARGLPWGASESGYAVVDADQNYQYRAFGDPRLGIKRGLALDRVVAPYATALALPLRPTAAVANLRTLVRLGMLGPHGFYEAADFTPGRAPRGEGFARVASTMAHHQGMILAAIDNALLDGILQRRFHADPHVRSADMLLSERVPPAPVIERAPEEAPPVPEPRVERAPEIPPWRPRRTGPHPETLLLGNGRLASLLTDAGAGALHWKGQMLTRWRADATRDPWGLWIYLTDANDPDPTPWSAGRLPTGRIGEHDEVEFQAHLAEFHRRVQGISCRLEVAVGSVDDVEVRLLTVVNETKRARRVTLASYAEIVLAPPAEDERHPAFSKLFVETEPLERLGGILCSRRPRDPEERPPVLLHRLAGGGTTLRDVVLETDRTHFLGRDGASRAPAALRPGAAGGITAGLDPIVSVRATIELAPGATRQVAFLTLVGGSRQSVLETAERYDSVASVDWLLSEAANESRRLLQRLGIEPHQVAWAHALLAPLVYGVGAPGASPESRRSHTLGQAGLWAFGISGDLPICLVRMPAEGEVGLVRDLVRFHALWAHHGQAVDLVLLREGGTGYQDDAGQRLEGLLRELGAEARRSRRGGIHVLQSARVRPEERALLEASAALVLDAPGDDLAAWPPDRHDLRGELPALRPTPPPRPPEPDAELPRPTDLLFDNGLGGFTPDGREYVIHLEPGRHTPTPWSNLLTNPDFGSLVTESGLGSTWALNSSENRLTTWSNDPVLDEAGEVLYLRDEETAVVFTPTPRPLGHRHATQVRHGAGTTEWLQRAHGLEIRLRAFVPCSDGLKIVHLTLQDLRGAPRRVTATYYAEWVLGTTRARASTAVVADYDAQAAALLAQSHWKADFAGRVAFLASDAPVHGFTTDREEFLGREGSLDAPAGLRRWGLSGATTPGADPCAALQVHIDLPAGAERHVTFFLGQGVDREAVRATLAAWRAPDAVEAGWRAVGERWDRLLGAVEIHTPDRALDVLANRWLLVQTVAARLEGRTGFQQPSGAFGFRDQIQDVLALVHAEPERTRAHLVETARQQFEEGDVLHWWHPPSGQGVRTRCADDLLWLPYAVAHYVESTGDVAILDEEVPFLRAPPLAADEHQRLARFGCTDAVFSLFEHCARALERGFSQGAHGLPLMRDGDWNDGMNRVGPQGRGESVWLAWFSVAAMGAFARLCDRRGEADLAVRWRARVADMARAVEQGGWDGAWYLRAYDDDGHVLGSARNVECRIDSVVQSWAVLSGAAAVARARTALLHAERELVRDEEGVVRLLWPPFTLATRDPGYIRGYPPGVRENGGHYAHAAAWLGLAFARLGQADDALRIARLFNPILHADSPEAVDHYRVEPYVVAADIATVAPRTGQGGWTWYTGSAAWTWRLIVEGLLGLRRVEGRLRIEPCLPRGWDGFSATVRTPKGRLQIHVSDPQGVGRGVAGVQVDGLDVEGTDVELPQDGAVHAVRVTLGRRRGQA